MLVTLEMTVIFTMARVLVIKVTRKPKNKDAKRKIQKTIRGDMLSK